jgi:hypothetical protein
VEDQEVLYPSALVRELTDAVEGQIHNLLSNGVVATRVVVRRVLLLIDDLLRMEQLPVSARTNLIDHGRVKVHEDSTINMLPGTRLGEEGVERVVPDADRLLRGNLALRLDTVLEALQLPTAVSDLDIGLTSMDRDNFTHYRRVK